MKTIPAVLMIALICAVAVAERPPAETPDAAARANNFFAADLYRTLSGTDGNLFFSPYSITTALAMTREGARGETSSEMDQVFHWDPRVPAASHRALEIALRPGQVREGRGEDAKDLPAFGLSVANALWAQEGLAVESPFTKTLADDFKAPLKRIDFRESAAARKIINDWVAEHTRDRIKDIVPEDLPTPDTLFALANAIWFKAAWTDPFQARWTKDAPFTTSAGETVTVPLMHRTGNCGYAEIEDAQVLEMEYRGGETSMVVVLPKAKDGLPAVAKRLDGKAIGKLIKSLERRHVQVKFPKFEITCPTDLTAILPKMGMPLACTAGKADFTGMTTEDPLFIGAVLHKAFVKVNEAGTEAAAATVVMMMRGGRPEVQAYFTADHPFLFLIRHNKRGAILFMGWVTDPS
jgi:serpin B